MPVLKNPKWERLAQELAQNKSATEAMKLAGYSDPRNSTRLTKKDEIRRRVEEIMSRGAARAEVSVASLLGELEEARARADSLEQLSASVRAIEAKAKVSGLLVQRVEVGGAGDFSLNDSLEDMANKMLADAGGPVELFRPVDQRDRQRLIDLLERFQTDLGEFFDAVRARPIVAERVDLANLRTDWHTLTLHPSEIGKGNQRRLTNGNGQKNRAP
jgi:hypothetical protein